LKEAGTGPEKVVKTTVLLADMADFGTVNDIYGEYFPSPYPARACYAVKQLPKSAKVEIECIALME
jgi:2-iminobutanoate/2-iminopropanoate deaminase